jgi:uncharacterized protein (DUF2384 family)
MTALQLPSEQPTVPLDGARAGVVLTRLAELMGLFERPLGARIDRRMVASVVAAAGAAGLADQVAARDDAAEPGEQTTLALLEALVASPRPTHEIGSLAAILGGYGELGALVGASEPSLRRYAAGTRTTPDAVAQRIHFIAQLVAIVRGSFNEFGVRRWFERPHPALGRRPPAALLDAHFDPSDAGPQATLAAAIRLLT